MSDFVHRGAELIGWITIIVIVAGVLLAVIMDDPFKDPFD